ncbi:MAG: Fe2+-dependent dioxygenase [Paracoccaceae bacterium]
MTMLLAVENLLSPGQTVALRDAAAALRFQDGRKTAGRFAAEVKANDQAEPSAQLDAIVAQAEQALATNALFTSATRPAAMTRLILSRYRAGQTYGLHVDDAMMSGLRTDVSFTLFLSDPETYDGGALIIEDSFEQRAVKLPAGSLFLYPSTTLHRVEPVAAGERLAIVGWVQSSIRRADQREILFDLDRAVAQVHADTGKSALFDSLAKSRSNLIRMWAAS